MKNTVLQFGLLTLLLVLLAQVSKYSLVLPGWGREAILSLFALGFLGAGFLLREKWRRSDAGNPSGLPGDSAARPPANPSAQQPATQLSQRETEVLVLMAEGLSNLEIGNRLFISESTVKTHVSNILLKLDARRRTEAISKAREMGLF